MATERVYLADNGKTLLCRGCNQKALSANDRYHDICMKRVATTAAYGVRFLSDGSVAHPWNGRTQEQRARECLAELRATYPRDRFALVIRDAPDQPWREADE